MNNNKPINNKWSFDKENRKPYDKSYIENKIISYNNIYITEAKKYIEKHFNNNFGLIEIIYYPITHKETKTHLQKFIKEKLETFGKYQDVISKNIIYGSHSILSPMLNIVLITPKEIIKEVLKYYNKNNTNITTVEAFIRQIIGWRSYVRFIYYFHGDEIIKMNNFKHLNNLPNNWYTGKTDLNIINDMIIKVKKYAYLHHIERLMIMGNFGFLNQIHPLYLYDWFMICFIDSYEWVMVANVFGMSQYALTNISMTTRPYICSTNYIKKMSNYKNCEWFDLWNSLYWYTIYKHQIIFNKIYSTVIQVNHVLSMKNDLFKNYIKTAKQYLIKNY